MKSYNFCQNEMTLQWVLQLQIYIVNKSLNCLSVNLIFLRISVRFARRFLRDILKYVCSSKPLVLTAEFQVLRRGGTQFV